MLSALLGIRSRCKGWSCLWKHQASGQLSSSSCLRRTFLLGKKDADKRRLLAQLRHLDGNYSGGLRAYLRNSKRLLEDSRLGVQSQC